MKKINTNTSLLLAFLLMMAAAIYLFVQNNALKARIEKFIPAAVQIENENKMLKDYKSKLEQDNIALSAFRDSIYSGTLKTSVQKSFNPTDSFIINNPAIPQTNTNGSFNDLNKGMH